MYFQNKPKQEISKKAVIYCRVSSEEQVKGYSLTVQEKLCREFIFNQGYELVEVFIEEGESAKTINRTQLNRLWNFCTQKKNNIKYIVTYKVDRIARNRDDYRQLGVNRKQYGLQVRSVTELFDDTPAGRFIEDMLANMAHFDNDVRTERSINGMREAVRQGRYVWKAPIGYENALIEGKSNLRQSDKAPLILKTFKAIESGLYSTEQIRLKMAKRGLVNKKGKPLSHSYFFSLLRNEVYAGWISKFDENHKGAFPAIVSEALFENVQLRLSGRMNRLKVYKHENPDFPLRRFVVNDQGKKLNGYWSKGRNKKYPYYSFAAKNSTIRKEVLEDNFKVLLDFFEFDGNNYQVLKDNLVYHLKLRLQSQLKERSRIEAAIKTIYQQMRHYSKNEYDGVIDRSLLKIHISDLTEELRSLEKKLELLSQDQYDVDELLQFAKGFLEKPSVVWDIRELDIKTRFQWFVFPGGLIYENSIFRTSKLCKLFKLKSEIEDFLSSNVPHTEKTKNTVSRTNSYNPAYIFQTKAFWVEIAEELKELKQIINK